MKARNMYDVTDYSSDVIAVFDRSWVKDLALGAMFAMLRGISETHEVW